MILKGSSIVALQEEIEARVAPLREQVATHPLYSKIQNIAQLRLFMESHVYAVWDFMSLLKALQRTLTCVEVPWVPTAFPASRRFINEIVLGEESDEYNGRPVSHFEIYLEAMERAGASTQPIRRFLERAVRTEGSRFDFGGVPEAAKRFMEDTFRFIHSGSPVAQAAAFAFGREDVIPDMFRSLVRDLNEEMDGDLTQFIWYLERHIEVDDDNHGPLALRMVADLCGNDPARWQEAARSATESIQSRLVLWDGILKQIDQK